MTSEARPARASASLGAGLAVVAAGFLPAESFDCGWFVQIAGYVAADAASGVAAPDAAVLHAAAPEAACPIAHCCHCHRFLQSVAAAVAAALVS